MGGPYFMENLLAIGFVVLGLVLVCVPRPRKAHTLTPEQYAKQQADKRRKKAFAAKKDKKDKVEIQIRRS